MPSLLVERAVDLTIARLRADLNGKISLVRADYADTIPLESVPASNYFIAEAYDPVVTPSVFVVADKTVHDLEYQQDAAQIHHMLVSVIVQERDAQRLTRKAWRFARALWLALHDAGDDDMRTLVDSLDYGPTWAGRGDARDFKKDATLRIRALHFENA